MNTLCCGFLDATFPNILQCFIQRYLITTRIHLINKGNIGTVWKYQIEFFISCGKDVVNTIYCAINNLNIFQSI